MRKSQDDGDRRPSCSPCRVFVSHFNFEEVNEKLTGFRGGLELLFADQRKLSISVPAKDDQGNPVTVGWLVDHLCTEHMKDSRKDMFVLDGHV